MADLPPDGSPDDTTESAPAPPPGQSRPQHSQQSPQQPQYRYPGPPRPGPPPTQQGGWYSGPFPPPGMSTQTGFGRALGLFTLKSLILVALIGAGWLVIVVAFAFVIGGLFAGLGAEVQTAGDFVAGDEDAGNVLLAIPVDGVILGEDEFASGGLFGFDATFGYSVKQRLHDAARDNSIDGVVVEMNTPGGTLYGSAAIADGIVEYAKTANKPIIAFVESLSASGGMWAMSPAEKIFADEGTSIGSIGVISGPFAYYNNVVAIDGGLLAGGVETRDGIDFTTITSGKGKGMGSPFRPLTPEEIAILQKSTDNSYNRFVEQIASTRGLSPEVIRDQIGAYIYDNTTAQQLGLIDATMNRDAAYAELAKMAGLSDATWKVVREPRSESGLGALFGQATGNTTTAELDMCTSPTVILAFYGDPTSLCPGE